MGYRGLTKEEQLELESISKQVQSELIALEKERKKVVNRAFWSRLFRIFKKNKG